MSPPSPFAAWFAALDEPAQRRLVTDYATRANAHGAYMVTPLGARSAIPPILTPTVVDDDELGRVSHASHVIIEALDRVTKMLMTDAAQAKRREQLFQYFSPLEQEALATTWREAQKLATVRVDFLFDRGRQPRALEVNATIPAMQAYSDIVAESFVRSVGEAGGLDADFIDRLLTDNGRNTDDLLASLLAHYRDTGGTRTDLDIAIVARRGDAQQGELEHYARRWSGLGHRAFVATVDEVKLDGDKATVRGITPDLIYRHIFARRMQPTDDFARMCLQPRKFRVFNPIASHLEVKGLLALLSEAATDSKNPCGLSEEERAVARSTIPWTRILSTDASSGPGGEKIDDLAAFTQANRDRLVLKRSWDYGGKGVFLGRELEAPQTQARLAAMFRCDTVDWPDLVVFALGDRDAWVVQELVEADPRPQLVLSGDRVIERPLFVDFSAFTNLGASPVPRGGAVRAAESRIVNILGGGGMAPLLRSNVLARLLNDGSSGLGTKTSN